MSDAITRIYRAIVAEAEGEGIDRKAALDQLVLQIRPLVQSGEVSIDIDEAIRAEGRRVDEKDGGRVDGVLRAIARGDDALDLDGDPVLDLVVTLGGGRRKIWRHVNKDDLREMDSLRYQNLHAQQLAYKRWRDEYESWVTVLFRHSTIGDAVAAGDLPQVDGLFGESA